MGGHGRGDHQERLWRGWPAGRDLFRYLPAGLVACGRPVLALSGCRGAGVQNLPYRAGNGDPIGHRVRRACRIPGFRRSRESAGVRPREHAARQAGVRPVPRRDRTRAHGDVSREPGYQRPRHQRRAAQAGPARRGPGPNRAMPPGATTLSAANSLFSSTYQWSIVSGAAGAAGAALSNPDSAGPGPPTFTAATAGTYAVQLVDGQRRHPERARAANVIVVVATNALPIAPAAIRFSDISAAMQTGPGGCTGAGCHVNGGSAPGRLREHRPQRRWRWSMPPIPLAVSEVRGPDQFHGYRRKCAAARALGPASQWRHAAVVRHECCSGRRPADGL